MSYSSAHSRAAEALCCSAALFRSVAVIGTVLSALALPAAHADVLDGPVERYRPLMIEEVGQALAGA
jgi:iron uptake system component EfeO